MSMQVVAYKGNEHLDTDFVNDLPLALVWINERKGWLDSFSIYPNNQEEDVLMGEIKDGTIVIHKMVEAH